MNPPLWDHNPKRRGGWAYLDGYVSHCYLTSDDGWLTQWCRPAFQIAAVVDMAPHPPEAPLCEKCAHLSGVADKLRRRDALDRLALESQRLGLPY